MKLRTRVTLAVATVTVVTLAAASVITLILVQRDELADLDRALSTQARLAARLIAQGDPAHPILESGTAEVPEHYEPALQYVAVFDASGKVLAETSSFRGQVPKLRRWAFIKPKGYESVSVDMEVFDAKLRGVLVTAGKDVLLYGASRSEVDTDVVFLARVLAILLGVSTLATALVARWLGRRLSSDVQDIAGVARDVASGNLGARAGDSIHGSAETRALAADLDHMIEQLGALVIAQHTFISHAAHELMSPLTTLRGELQLSVRRPRTADEQEKTIAQALADVEALVLLAKDLLTLARVESAVPGDQDATISDIVTDAVHAAKGGADARGVALVAVEQTALAMGRKIKGARRQLSRALRNLLDNAVVHSESGGTVRVVVSAQGDTTSIAVEDTGPGVPASDRSYVFEPFFRGSRERVEADQGVGLGLAIARQIARRSGGELELDDQFSSGARFVLRLRDS